MATTTSTAQLLDLLVVAWALPATRLAHWVPAGTQLDRLPTADGETVGFVEFHSSWRTDARWSALPGGWGETYRHAELRVLVRAADQPAVAVVASWVDHPALAKALVPVSRVVEEARIEVHVDGNPAAATMQAIETSVRTDHLVVRLACTATADPPENPWGPRERLSAFFTDRTLAVHPARLPKGAPLATTIAHAPLETLPLRIVDAAIDHPIFEGCDLRNAVFAGWASATVVDTGAFRPLRRSPPASVGPETATPQPGPETSCAETT